MASTVDSSLSTRSAEVRCPFIMTRLEGTGFPVENTTGWRRFVEESEVLSLPFLSCVQIHSGRVWLGSDASSRFGTAFPIHVTLASKHWSCHRQRMTAFISTRLFSPFMRSLLLGLVPSWCRELFLFLHLYYQTNFVQIYKVQ